MFREFKYLVLLDPPRLHGSDMKVELRDAQSS